MTPINLPDDWGVSKSNQIKSRQRIDLVIIYKTWGHERFFNFKGLPASIAEKLMTGYPNIEPTDVQNDSPTAEEMIRIAKRHNGTLIGYVDVGNSPEFNNISIQGFVIKASPTTITNLKYRLRPTEFSEDKPGYWRYWWD